MVVVDTSQSGVCRLLRRLAGLVGRGRGRSNAFHFSTVQTTITLSFTGARVRGAISN